MITAKKLNLNFIAGYMKSLLTDRLDLENPSKNSTLSKVNSLAYLAYKSKKKKGLIAAEQGECPTIYFGDEWGF